MHAEPCLTSAAKVQDDVSAGCVSRFARQACSEWFTVPARWAEVKLNHQRATARDTGGVEMKSVCRFRVPMSVLVGLTLAVMYGSAAAFGGGGSGHGGGGHGGGGHGGGWGGHGWGGHGWGGHGWGGYGYFRHGYGCCGWGLGFVDPLWYPYPWGGYGYGYDYAYPYEYGDPPADPVVAPPPPPAPSYWYYCPDSRSYYPYVRQCPSAWQAVTPTR